MMCQVRICLKLLCGYQTGQEMPRYKWFIPGYMNGPMARKGHRIRELSPERMSLCRSVERLAKLGGKLKYDGMVGMYHVGICLSVRCKMFS